MRRLLVVALVVSGACILTQAHSASAAVIPQTLSWTPATFPNSVPAGTTLAVSVAASSGLPVTITTTGACTGGGVDSASVAAVLPSGVLQGTCEVHADQAGTSATSGPPTCYTGLTSDITSPDGRAHFVFLPTDSPAHTGLEYHMTGGLAVVHLVLHLADGSAIVQDWPTGRTDEPDAHAEPRQRIESFDVCKQEVTAGYGSVSETRAFAVGNNTQLEYVPVARRILETRDTCWLTSPGGYVPTGYTPTVVPADRRAARVGAGTTVELQVTGPVDITPQQCTSPKVKETPVPVGAKAVAINVTGVNATADGYVTVWDCTTPRPTASSLNLSATPLIESWDRDAHAKLVVTNLSARGTVCLFTQSGTDLVADLQGYFPAASGYAPITVTRVVDTRDTGVVAAGGTLRLAVAGPGHALPADTGAVVMNVTGLGAPANGFVTVWDCNGAVPGTSNLNLAVGQVDSTLVVSKVGATGEVCLFSSSGGHLVVDVGGSFPRSLVGTCPSGAKCFVPLDPKRVLDTRTGVKPVAGQIVHIPLASTPLTAVLTITGIDATHRGFVTAWDCVSQPFASNLNMEQGQGAENVVIIPTSPTGEVCIYTQAGAHFVVDLSGAFPLSG
jgi:hypothetical protein